VRITVDFDICESNAVCMQYAPDIFEVGDDDLLMLLHEEVPAGREDAVGEAVRRCPRQAIRLAD
jgi:ferredoxin